MKLIDRIIALLYPARCAVCDSVMTNESHLCPECSRKIRPVKGPNCYRCGKTLSRSGKVYCYDCSRKIHYYDRGYAVFEYSDIKRSLYRFKYKGRAEYASFYALSTVSLYGNILRSLKADAIIPVPIHKRRHRDRGYNQAELYARELSELLDVPIMTDVIRRVKYTVPLKKLRENQRANTLKRAFTIVRNDVQLNTIIIVDDIYTTGATIDAIARLFKSVGVKNIYFITVAIGKGI